MMHFEELPIEMKFEIFNKLTVSELVDMYEFDQGFITDVIRLNKTHPNEWREVSFTGKQLPIEFVRDFKDRLNWAIFTSSQKFNDEEIREFQDKINWSSASVYQELSEEIMFEFKDKLDWEYVSMHQSFSVDFVKNNIQYIDMSTLITCTTISEEFIEQLSEFFNSEHWRLICEYQCISEQFMRKFEDKIHWFTVYYTQDYSAEFENEFYYRFTHEDDSDEMINDIIYFNNYM